MWRSKKWAKESKAAQDASMEPERLRGALAFDIGYFGPLLVFFALRTTFFLIRRDKERRGVNRAKHAGQDTHNPRHLKTDHARTESSRLG